MAFTEEKSKKELRENQTFKGAAYSKRGAGLSRKKRKKKTIIGGKDNNCSVVKEE